MYEASQCQIVREFRHKMWYMFEKLLLKQIPTASYFENML